MKRSGVLGLACALICSLSVPAFAHFQMVYTPESALTKPETLNLKLVFTHPFEAGHTMDMDGVDSFVMLHKGKKTDLTKSVKPIMWTSLTNSGKGYEAEVPLRGMGDFVFGLVPMPYFEASEGIWMQQCTKMIVNVAGLPTDWNEEIGLPAEIVPLDKPYGLWTGNVFRGVVKANGEPVPFAEIEVEYLNHLPMLEGNSFAAEAAVEAPQDCFVTQTIVADANGTFVYSIPKAGWWGFAALGVITEEYKGAELGKDAVIWVQARDMN
ncbi:MULTISPECIES: DUF4198 domain-containing protein [Dethiosulfovibrio]|uniref:DUF4198 domain-containing protein n=2 Tax=Dethiosulfovibrio TaxID=47054 RepID=A0ABS9ET77_9BACT|nr:MULTISPECIES: DUF4198 domain-containing protein [Dethiosulfovibrio]MCF4115188.1 DUF4198 domain-containing protein [Dethiosulfovibrio russensis]MCF4143651.1 DUF4198 domain-containing protein [Dethiosulfovibrio marinus]MCF4146114.1 DUF4198 domain-containing protein [Dethiosulfovibrio acidaminovorans]